MGSVLARATRGTRTAIIQMGETAVFLNPPIRVAEEYAMLDCISEGRMVAGFPLAWVATLPIATVLRPWSSGDVIARPMN